MTGRNQIRNGSIVSGPTLPEPIEVKGRTGVGIVALSENEYRTAERLKDDYWLYAVFNYAGTPELHTIRNPARLGWQPVMAIEHYRIGPEQICTAENGEDRREDSDEVESPRPSVSSAVKNGFLLEFDADRKIAQGLGIHLEQCESIVEVKGDKARLLPVSERTRD